jgi:hypothetical protein
MELSKEEIWKDISDYEGLYQASSLGRIRSLDRYKITKNRYGKIKAKIKGIFLKPSINHDGYYEIVLSKNGKSKMFRLHRVIAKTFLDNLENKPQVNHIDGNKLNNNINNLEWCTCKENINHAWENGLSYISDKHKMAISKSVTARWEKYRENKKKGMSK